ncbi:MAG: hypothetical protein IPK19_38870 [Chloroflexi bacterium]|nr:hypothetical protein [Chloroflexota bacterium]
MTRLWADGKPIAVEADAESLPLRFTWEGENHPIDAILDCWRVDTDWWRGRVWRMVFRVVTETGLLVELYHDLLLGGWYMQRVYD